MITTWLQHYGYIVLFTALMLELIIVGIPAEVIMSYTGFLVFQGKMGWALAVLTAGLGSVTGITISYWIGLQLGAPFFHKYGYKIHLGPERLEKTSQWFSKYGNKLLVVAYFITGIRHVTGYFSGITKVPFRIFAIFAYMGAFLWVFTFISLGKVLGPKWELFHHSMRKYLVITGILAAILFVLIYLYRNYRQRMWEAIRVILERGVATYHSLGRVKFLVVGAAVVFFALFVAMLGLIQDYWANEFVQFDAITLYLVHSIFGKEWAPWMERVSVLASYKVMIPIVVMIILWILRKGENRRLEIMFLLIALIGGELLDEGLRRLFHRLGPAGTPSPGQWMYTFPGEQTLMVLSVYGFVAFLLVRHSGNPLMHIVAPLAVLAISALVGLSRIFLELQYPSDVLAGLVFGGVWLSLQIILLEVFRQLGKDHTII